jgi:hypothetical protein
MASVKSPSRICGPALPNRAVTIVSAMVPRIRTCTSSESILSFRLCVSALLIPATRAVSAGLAVCALATGEKVASRSGKSKREYDRNRDQRTILRTFMTAASRA